MKKIFMVLAMVAVFAVSGSTVYAYNNGGHNNNDNYSGYDNNDRNGGHNNGCGSGRGHNRGNGNGHRY